MGLMDNYKEKYKKIANAKLKEKPFAIGMYSFVMFLINYYSRIRKELRLDYDSFMIIQVVVSHSLYQINKEPAFCRICSNRTYCTHVDRRSSFSDLGYGWDDIIKKNSEDSYEQNLKKIPYRRFLEKDTKLSISSICLVTSLPKETVRRKTGELCKKKILNCSSKKGITIGSNYKKIFDDFVPETTYAVMKLMKNWQQNGVLKSLLDLEV